MSTTMLFNLIDPTVFTASASEGGAEAAESATRGAETIKEGIEQIKTFSFNDLIADLSQRLVHFAIDIAVAILVFYIGKFIINRIYRLVATIMVRRNIDRSLTTFILSFVKIVLYFILIVTVIGILGIETSSFLAIFASAGVAIGMALSGTLQNFAGGVLILLLKPYKIGDYIEAQGYAGTVREIQIFHTIISTPDNKAIIIPNGGLSTSSINNWSRERYRRVQWDVAISYGDKVDDARRAILEMLAADPRIANPDNQESENGDNEEECIGDDCKEPRRSWFYRLFHRHHNKVRDRIEQYKDANEARISSLKADVVKAPEVVVKELADSSVNISVRAWVKSTDYWSVYYDYNERIYAELPEHGINFPFPQMDVHVKN